jgi:hypothetical protein
MPFFRTLLILSRPSYLPTIWSNIIAGWWLGGGGSIAPLPWLLTGSTFLYLGGAFLNDAFDSAFDHQHHRNYPIPSGLISPRTVWGWGFLWLAVGIGVLTYLDKDSGILGVALSLWILGYNSSHRAFVLSPLLLGTCRFFVYMIGASGGFKGITGWSIWAGLAVSIYVTGVVGFFSSHKTENRRRWLLVFLLAPIFLALVMNGNEFREGALLLSLVVALWGLRCLRHTFWSSTPDVGLTVSGLLSGIVLVDWLAAVDAPKHLSVVFIALFLAALGLQRLSPGRRLKNILGA